MAGTGGPIPPPRDPSDTRIVIGYARVSTLQDDQTISIESQEREFVRLGVDLVIKERKSASKKHVRRAGWDELRVLVASRRVRIVLVSDLSRLARDGSDMEFLEECSAVGTEVRDLNGKVWENQSLDGLLTSGVTSLMNRVQARLIGVKAADGLRRRREAGFLARGMMPFGYAVVDGQPAMHHRNWLPARELFDRLLSNRMNISGTIRELPADFAWSPTSVGLTHWFQNPMLRGGIGSRRIKAGLWEDIEWGRAPVLISQHEFDTAMALYRARRNARTTDKSPQEHLYTSMIRCMGCGHNMGWAYRRRETHAPRYQCRRPQCKWHGKTVREDLVTTQVAAALCERAQRMAAIVLEDQPMDISPEEARLREQLRQLEALEDQGVSGLRPTILGIRDQIAVLRMAPLEEVWLHPDYQRIFSDPATFELGSVDDLRPVVVQFVKRIEYRADTFEIKVVLRR